VEIVNVRLRMVAAGEPFTPERRELGSGEGSGALAGEREIYFDGGCVPARLYSREGLKPGERILGPAMITEYTAATVLPPGASALVDGFGNLVISVWDGVAG
jgi:N-methylhydantoinase A